MSMTYVTAPEGFEGETGSHIEKQAASQYFTVYRTADGYSWDSLAKDDVRAPDGVSYYIHGNAAVRPAPDVYERCLAVLRAVEVIKEHYKAAKRAESLVAVYEASEWRSPRGLTLNEEMDRADSDY